MSGFPGKIRVSFSLKPHPLLGFFQFPVPLVLHVRVSFSFRVRVSLHCRRSRSWRAKSCGEGGGREGFEKRGGEGGEGNACSDWLCFDS